MRLGGPVFGHPVDPDRWAAAVRALGYSAAYCPVARLDGDLIRAYARAAAAADVVIAEVGAWSNPISPDEEIRRAAVRRCEEKLALADQIGARCCVNVAGSRHPSYPVAGPHPDNLTPDTFDLIVQSVRQIIDAVKPTRTFYTLETDPWCYPNTPDSYVALLAAIDRRQFGVHLDPVNLVWSPPLHYRNGDLIRECFAKLGPAIKSCHAKDTSLSGKSTAHLDEVRPGLGALDYRTLLRELDVLDPDTPLMIEHLASAEEYELAATYIRSVASDVGVVVRCSRYGSHHRPAVAG